MRILENPKFRDFVFRLLPPSSPSEIRGTMNYLRFRKLWDPAKIKRFQNLHFGQTIFIVGGGSSLNDTNLRALRSEVVIFVNSSVRLKRLIAPSSSYWIIAGGRMNEFRHWNRLQFDGSFRCTGAYTSKIEKGAISKNDILLRIPVRFGLFKITDDSRRNFSHDLGKEICWGGGGTVVFEALQLAKYMGVKKVILVGFDVGVRDDHKSHFDEDLERVRAIIEDRRPRVLKALGAYKKIFDDAGIELVNGSAWSKETVLPRIEI